MNAVTPAEPVTATETRSRAWRIPDFRRLWFASTVSWFGAELGELAIPLLAVLTLSASAGEVGILRAAQFLPFLLATLPLGLVVDRRRRRPLMITADAGRCLLLLTIPVAVWAELARMPWLYAVVFGCGVLTVLHHLADFAFLPRVVPPHQLVDANGKLSASQSATEIGGKGAGGVLVQALTAPGAILVNAAGYLVSAVSLTRIGTPEPATEPATGRQRRWREAVEGLRIVVTNRYLRPLLGEATTFNLANEVFLLGLLLYTVRDLGMSPAQLGLVFTGSGAGSFLGAWFGARVGRRFGYGRVLLITLVAGNTAPAAVWFIDGPATALPVLLTAFLVMGIGIGMANVHAVSLRQAAVPDHVQGRVNAGYRLISWGALPVGAGLGGLLASILGGHGAMLMGAFALPVATLWVVLSPIRRLATIDDATPGSG